MKGRVINTALKLLNRSGIHIMRSYRIPRTNLNLLLLSVPALLYQKDTVFFLQIGAADGVTNDPLFPLIQQYHTKLKGVSLEPLPDVFDKLKANYKRYPEIKLENAALTDTDGEVKIYRPVNTVDNSVSQKSSLKKEIVMKHGFRQPRIEELSVKGISVQSLFKKYQISYIDLLQVDTEGNDYNIIYSILSYGFIPSIIHYENLHLSKKETEYIRQLLTQNKYQIIETAKDSLAVKQLIK